MQILSNEYILYAVAVVCIITVYFAAVLLFKRNAVQARTRHMLQKKPALALDEMVLPENKRAVLAERLEEMFAALGVDVEKARRSLYAPLGRAGFNSPDAFSYYLFFQRVIQPISAVIGFVFFFFWLMHKDPSSLDAMLQVIVSLIFIVIGFYGGKLYLTNRRQKREKRLERSFPDAIDLLLVCIESGLSLDTALARVCRELKIAYPDITNELERTRMELSVMNDREQALRNLAERTNTGGFKALVSSLLQSEKFGTNLSDTLRVLSEDYRMTRLLNAENRAARIPALITVPLIFFIMPAFMLVIMGPAIIKLNQQGPIFGQ